MIAGVDVALATLPARPLADTTETVVTVPAPDGELKVRLPEPSVAKNCPFVPSTPGSVNVVLDDVLADCKVVVPVPLELP